MGRTLKKGPFIADSLLRKVEKQNSDDDKSVIKTWSRASVIMPDMLMALYQESLLKSQVIINIQEV